MLRRHQFRIKAMQALYGFEISDKNNFTTILASTKLFYDKILKESEGLFYFFIQVVIQISERSTFFSESEKNKLIVSNINLLKLNTKILSNTVVLNMTELKNAYEKNNKTVLKKIDDKDTLNQLFLSLFETEEYQTYLQTSDATSDANIVCFILKHIVQNNETIESLIDDWFINALDDTQGILHLLIDLIKKNKMQNQDACLLDRESVLFGGSLLKTYIEKNDFLESIISKHTDNWEKERMILIDKIIIKLSVCEFLYFDEIPISVSINEYIEMSKNFSTPDSKKFINGVLDNIKKYLIKEEKISNTKKESIKNLLIP